MLRWQAVTSTNVPGTFMLADCRKTPRFVQNMTRETVCSVVTHKYNIDCKSLGKDLRHCWDLAAIAEEGAWPQTPTCSSSSRGCSGPSRRAIKKGSVLRRTAVGQLASWQNKSLRKEPSVSKSNQVIKFSTTF